MSVRLPRGRRKLVLAGVVLCICVLVLFSQSNDRLSGVKDILPEWLEKQDGSYWLAFLLPLLVSLLLPLVPYLIKRWRRQHRTLDEMIVVTNIIKFSTADQLSYFPAARSLRLKMQVRTDLSSGSRRDRASSRRSDSTVDVDTLPNLFDRSHGLMLLVGARGSGKSVALVRLIENFPQKDNGPIPILVNVSGWDGSDLEQWLPRAVRRQYQGITEDVASRFSRDRFIWLLDDLDRTSDPHAFVSALKTYSTARLSRMVVAGSSGLSRSLLRKLGAEEAYEILAPHTRDAVQFLKDSGAAAHVVEVVARETGPTPFLRLPLALRFIMELLESDIDRIRGAEPEKRYRELAAIYISRQTSRLNPSMRHWLRWIAWTLQRRGDGVFLPDRINEEWLSARSRDAKGANRIVLGQLLVLGAAVGATCLLLVDFALDPTQSSAGQGKDNTLSQWFAVLVITALPVAFGYRVLSIQKGVHPVEGLTWSWSLKPFSNHGDLAKAVGVGSFSRMAELFPRKSTLAATLLLIGSQAGAISICVFVITKSVSVVSPIPVSSIGAVMISVIVLHLVAQIEDRFVPRLVEERDPFTALRRSARYAAVGAGIVFGVVTAAMFLALWLAADRRAENAILVCSLCCALFLATIQGLLLGGYAVIRHYAARSILWSEGHLPLRLNKFLDAQSQGLLLQARGSGYAFAHSVIQEELAEQFVAAKPSGRDVTQEAGHKAVPSTHFHR